MARPLLQRYRHGLWAPVLAALALGACTPQQAEYVPERVVEPRTSNRAAPRGPGLLRSAMLDGHNAARRAAGVAPIVWNDALAASARSYARELARSGRFEHADQPHGPGREGENLWTGTRGAYTYSEMVGHWVAERRDFVNGPTPAFSRTGRWQDVAHYTQIVWRGTTAVGCAVAAGPRDEVLVCRYAPPGNVAGTRAL